MVKYTEPIKILVHVLIFTINCRVNQSILYAFFKAFCAKVHRNFGPLLYASVTFTQTVFNLPLYCLNFETLSSLCLSNTQVQTCWFAPTLVSKSACHLIDIWALSTSKTESQHPFHRNFLPKDSKAVTSFTRLFKVIF